MVSGVRAEKVAASEGASEKCAKLIDEEGREFLLGNLDAVRSSEAAAEEALARWRGQTTVKELTQGAMCGKCGAHHPERLRCYA